MVLIIGVNQGVAYFKMLKLCVCFKVIVFNHLGLGRI